MKLKQLLEQLNQLAKERPEALEMAVEIETSKGNKYEKKMIELQKELSEIKEACLRNFTKGIKHDTKELAEMVVLIENQIYQLARIIEEIIQCNKQ